MRLSRKARRELYRESVKRTSGRYRTTQAAIENAIPNPTSRQEMSWGPAYSFDAINNQFGIMEFKGTKLVAPSAPAWYRTVRTDTTDRQDRAKSSREVFNNW